MFALRVPYFLLEIPGVEALVRSTKKNVIQLQLSYYLKKWRIGLWQQPREIKLTVYRAVLRNNVKDLLLQLGLEHFVGCENRPFSKA